MLSEPALGGLSEPDARIALLGIHSAQIAALQEDRKRQNGTLDRLETKLDSLIFKLLAALCAFGLASGGWLFVLLKH